MGAWIQRELATISWLPSQLFSVKSRGKVYLKATDWQREANLV